jgi:high-affinity iron transporter
MMDLSAFFQSGTILLREGLEAMLVIAALAAMLRRAGASEALKPLYVGAAVAIVASIGAAVVFAIFYNGAHDDMVEAVIMALAAALMFYMSGWLFLRQNPRAWQAELKQLADRALASRTAWSLAAISFLAVFREGGETVLFLHAAAMSTGGWGFGMFAGLLAAAVALAIIYVAMQWLALKLPLRPVFLVTSAFLFVMALRFVAGAVQEIQEQGFIAFHPARLPEWLQAVGVASSWEGLGIQMAVAAAAVISTFVLAMKRPSLDGAAAK